MPPTRKSPEEKALREHAKQAREKEQLREREAKARENLRQDFYKSPEL
jgi:hypothetical protein